MIARGFSITSCNEKAVSAFRFPLNKAGLRNIYRPPEGYLDILKGMSESKKYVLKGSIRKLPASWEAHMPVLGITLSSYSTENALEQIRLEVQEKFQFSELELQCENGEIFLRFQHDLFFLEKIKNCLSDPTTELPGADPALWFFEEV